MPAAPKIDRAKLRAAIRRLGDEYVYFLLDEALDLLSEGKLVKLVGQYIDMKKLRRDGASRGDPFEEVTEFQRASLAGEYYESFYVDSKNYMQMSNGTRAWIAECRRLLDQLVAASKQVEPGKVGEGFETFFDLLRRIDEGHDDVIFFADEGGSWQVGVDWKNIFPAWFRCLAKTATPEEYAARVLETIDDLDKVDRDIHLAAARRAATPAQRKALAPPGQRARKA